MMERLPSVGNSNKHSMSLGYRTLNTYIVLKNYKLRLHLILTFTCKLDITSTFDNTLKYTVVAVLFTIKIYMHDEVYYILTLIALLYLRSALLGLVKNSPNQITRLIFWGRLCEGNYFNFKIISKLVFIYSVVQLFIFLAAYSFFYQ